jgi:hypothetical protein
MEEKNVGAFKELTIGDMFIVTHPYCDEKRLRMKMNPVEDADGYTYNAVCLTNGNVYSVQEDCRVRLVQANITY